jgi:hypothetical protein
VLETDWTVSTSRRFRTFVWLLSCQFGDCSVNVLIVFNMTGTSNLIWLDFVCTQITCSMQIARWSKVTFCMIDFQTMKRRQRWVSMPLPFWVVEVVAAASYFNIAPDTNVMNLSSKASNSKTETSRTQHVGIVIVV